MKLQRAAFILALMAGTSQGFIAPTPSSVTSSFPPTMQTTILYRSSCSTHPTTTSSSSSSSSTTTTSLHMMFDQLSSALSEVAKNFSGPKQRITESSIKPALRQVRRALLDADVNLDVADTLIEGVRKRSLGQEVLKGVTAEQQFIKAYVARCIIFVVIVIVAVICVCTFTRYDANNNRFLFCFLTLYI